MDVELAKLWVERMMEHDSQYREWARAYTGKTDPGETAELWEVAPGAMVNGPVGYMRVDSFNALIKPWDWVFVTRGFFPL